MTRLTPCLVLSIVSILVNGNSGTRKAFYSSKTPYKPPASSLDLPAPPPGYEVVCAQILARHGCRALEGRKYDKLTMDLWTLAKDENALTEYGQQFGDDLQAFIRLNDRIGFVGISDHT